MAQGVYWIGQDNNIYIKAAGQNGVKNVGPLGVTNLKNFSGLQEIADPSAPVQGTTYTNGSGGGGSGSSGPADLSSFDQGIDATNSQINNLTPTLNNEIGGANDAYQTTVNSLLQGKATADNTYKQNKTQDSQEYSTNKNAIRTNTGQTINGIDTVLGEHGGAGQSAGDYAALLAGKAGTGQLNNAGTTFGKNEQGLDTNYNGFMTGFNTNMTNAGLQKESDINKATANMQVQKANLLQGLASLINQRTSAAGGKGTAASQPYVNEANSLLTSASAIGAPRAVAPITPTTYTPPTLASYTTNPTAVSVGGAPSGATDTSQPFYTTLLNRDKTLQAA